MNAVWDWLIRLGLRREMGMSEQTGGSGSYGCGEKGQGSLKRERRKVWGHRTELGKHQYFKSLVERETDFKILLRETHPGVSNVGQRSGISR